MERKIRVGIIEDDKLLTLTYRNFLPGFNDLELVCLFPGVEELEDSITAILQPDIFLVDLRLAGKSGIEGIELIKRNFPTTKILVLTVSLEGKDVVNSLRTGADGYMVKTSNLQDVYMAIKEVMQTGGYLSNDIVTALIRELQKRPENDEHLNLTKREVDVILQLERGLSDKEIASRLFITTFAVNQHLKHIYRKLGVCSRIELLAFMFNEVNEVHAH